MSQKSKSPLALMEQAVMILVFAVAATLCVQAFVKADTLSKGLYDRDRAVNVSQTVAESVKAKHGDLQAVADMYLGKAGNGELLLYYNETWENESEAAAYELRLVCGESDGYVTSAEIQVTKAKDGELLFSLPVSWQEVQNE